MSRDTKSFKLSKELLLSLDIKTFAFLVIVLCTRVYWPIYWFPRDTWIRTQRACNFLSDAMCYYLREYLAVWSTAQHMKPNLIGGPLLKNCLIGGHLIDSDLSPQLLPFKASQGSFPWERGVSTGEWKDSLQGSLLIGGGGINISCRVTSLPHHELFLYLYYAVGLL